MPELTGPQPTEPQQVYDSVYGRVVEVDPNDPVVAANPQRFEPVANQQAHMLNPAGQVVSVPASQAASLGAAGWQYLPDEAARHAVAVQHFVKKYDDAARVGFESYANTVLLGVPDTVEEHSVVPEMTEAKRIAHERHPFASGIGTAAGLLSGALISGGIGSAGAAGEVAGRTAAQGAIEQAAPGMIGRVARSTAITAAEGGLWSTPQAAAELAYGDKEKAAETLLWGVGTGALLGFGAGSLAEVSRAGKAAAGLAAEKAAAAGLVTPEGKLDFKKFGIAAPEEAAKLHGEATKALAEHSAILDREIAKAPAAVRDGLGVSGAELADKVAAKLPQQAEGLKLTGFADEGSKALNGALQTIAGRGDAPMTFEGLSSLRKELVEAGVGDAQKMRILRQVDSIVEGEQSKAMAQAFAKVGDASKYGGYLETLNKLQQANTQAVGLMAPSAAQQWIGQKVGNTVAGGVAGAVGGAVGNAIGGPVGGWIGYKAMKPVLETTIGHVVSGKASDVAGRALTSLAKNEGLAQWFGAALTKDLVGASERRLGNVSRQLVTGYAGSVAGDAIKDYLGKRANGLSRSQQFDAVSKALNDAQANQQRVAEELGAMRDVLHHDPQLADAFARAQLGAVAYLQQALPKPPAPVPFRAPQQWQPAPAERAAFERKLEVKQNPFAVLDHIARGDLTKDHVEAVKTLYPRHYEEMVGRLAEMAADPRAAKLSPGSKASIQLFTGVPLTSRPGDNWQQAYQPKGNKSPAQGPAPQRAVRGTGKLKGPELETPTQRLANR